MASKKERKKPLWFERNLKITVEQKSFQRGWLEKGKRQVLDEPQSHFPFKNGQLH